MINDDHRGTARLAPEVQSSIYLRRARSIERTCLCHQKKGLNNRNMLHYITLQYITLRYITLRMTSLHTIAYHHIQGHAITYHYITLRIITCEFSSGFKGARGVCAYLLRIDWVTHEKNTLKSVSTTSCSANS